MSLSKSLASMTVLMMASAAPAFARQTKKVDVYYQSFDTYYSCSGAEGDLSAIIKQLGGQKIKTSCNGGLQTGFVDINATFTVADSTDANASWDTVHLSTDAGCGFAKTALKEILPAFSTNNVHINDNCGTGPNQALEGTLSVWK